MRNGKVWKLSFMCMHAVHPSVITCPRGLEVASIERLLWGHGRWVALRPPPLGEMPVGPVEANALLNLRWNVAVHGWGRSWARVSSGTRGSAVYLGSRIVCLWTR